MIIWVKMLGMFGSFGYFFDDYEVNKGKNGGEGEGADDVGDPVHVGENAADANEDGEGEHEKI